MADSRWLTEHRAQFSLWVLEATNPEIDVAIQTENDDAAQLTVPYASVEVAPYDHGGASSTAAAERVDSPRARNARASPPPLADLDQPTRYLANTRVGRLDGRPPFSAYGAGATYNIQPLQVPATREAEVRGSRRRRSSRPAAAGALGICICSTPCSTLTLYLSSLLRCRLPSFVCSACWPAMRR